jgi:hypothetical protein
LQRHSKLDGGSERGFAFEMWLKSRQILRTTSSNLPSSSSPTRLTFPIFLHTHLIVDFNPNRATLSYRSLLKEQPPDAIAGQEPGSRAAIHSIGCIYSGDCQVSLIKWSFMHGASISQPCPSRVFTTHVLQDQHSRTHLLPLPFDLSHRHILLLENTICFSF